MKVLVVGAGMYVTGRAGSGVGTVLAALAELSRDRPLDVVVAARNRENAAHLAEAEQRINGLLGTDLRTSYEQLTGTTTLASVLERHAFDCAIVSVPDHLHYPITRTVLEKAVPPLVVKPLTPTLAEARALVALARERNCYGAVEFHKRYDEANLYARKVVDEETLGRLLYVTVEYSQRISIPTVTFRDWVEHTNIFQYLAVHYVDLIHFLTGYLPVRASAIGTNGVLREKGIGTYDSVHATVVWRDSRGGSRELVSQFAVNWIDPETSPAMSNQKYKIVGTAGRLELDQTNRGISLNTGERGVQAINLYFSEFLPAPDGRYSYCGYAYQSIRRFVLDVADIKSGRRSPESLEDVRPSFRSALPATAVVEAVNASLARQGAWEEIDAVF